MRSSDTLGNTPFQLISDLINSFMLIKVFSVLSMLSKLPPGVCWRGGGATGLLNKGGGSNRLPGLVTKQQELCGISTGTGYNYYGMYYLTSGR